MNRIHRAWLLALLLVACSPTGPSTPTIDRIEISPGGLLLATEGESRRLTAVAYDSAGDTMEVELRWSSSRPSDVSVAEDGTVRSEVAVGSAQVWATVGTFRSTPILVTVAQLVPEAITVPDERVVGEIVTADPQQALVLGSRYDVTLTDTVGVTVGDVLVASESASLVGRVVAVTEAVVTLEVIPLDEVVVALDLGEDRLDLSTAAYQVTPETERYFDVTTSDAGLYHLDLKPGVELTSAIGTQAAEFSVGPFDCSASGTVASIDLAVAKFTLAPNLDLHVEWNSQRRALIVTGQPTITYQFKPVLNAALDGSVDCRITLLEPKIPLPGFLGFFLGGVIPIGTGFQIQGQLPVASVGLEVTGSLGLNVAAGFDCPATQSCSYPSTLESHGTPPKIAPVAPQLPPGVKLELTAHAYAF
ncbi:MAG TPA: hypothetical protein VFN03_00370, partial [Trueperaceae bacterium]|nr:hypothetical protein [Trueperaceae bacterium]